MTSESAGQVRSLRGHDMRMQDRFSKVAHSSLCGCAGWHPSSFLGGGKDEEEEAGRLTSKHAGQAQGTVGHPNSNTSAFSSELACPRTCAH